jgi:hypothetical protein
MQTGNYPQVAALAEDAFGMPHEELFEFGLARILDGLEQQFRNREHTE